MTRLQLHHHILQKQSFLCVGLDTDVSKLPKHLLDHPEPIFEFNRQIIDATRDFCVAYKLNTAFYETLGKKGWEALEKTLDYLPDTHFAIADAKRGDIGNTSKMYAKAFFETMNFDAVTVAPYMGEDSVLPFLGFENKWVILLALTSNKGSADFQMTPQEDGRPLFEKVLRKAQDWGTPENLMFVIGATHPEQFDQVRAVVPDHFLLVPGVGEQGGDLQKISKHGMNERCGLLVNSSRAIIYAGSGENFAEVAAASAKLVQTEMAGLLAVQPR
ncbi:MAG: orotidine-5'-phosphate decarboxylase [Saprospiraceae bacterium]|nr:orotidine-5'-phosphate decarboxylase [Saprospiraceae bacterium]MDZ4703200.1 orotidine-5'-phosphate decarboxylase [Saprospiraceae bacterium]